ncbi:unnamed protein product [Rotaria sp. Silwood2]|nr:unnamed protein product [Rotaria sp. Silwood2]CAF3145205.1 unnamed protein product [Rotaria sp. Silwood2]CAF3313938.1 unnamed protein product [Rotaria sp. Silwood2]CAF4083520.1 unnamed protein product [Rotaria sp. Silwood2]CAF4319178.1 unnamed protein product [Rotaria sp. Silwood2]
MFKNQTNYTENDRSLIKKTQRMRRKQGNQRYKLLLTCVVCNGDAHGYNFDAISCESCKAFFRRNALRPPGKLKCCGNGQCNISFDQKKRCMRKEWILTDKEKQEKRIKIEQNRRLRQIHDNDKDHQQQYIKRKSRTDSDLSMDFQSFSPLIDHQKFLTHIDLSKIELLHNAYTEAVKLNQTAGIPQYPLIQPISSTLELFRVPIYISSMRLITFFKQIPEFQQLDRDEQVYFVKLNTLTIAFLHSIYIYDNKTEIYHEPDTNDPLFLEKDWMNTINNKFHYEMKQIQNNFININQFDDKIMKIFFLIILFSNYHTFKYSTTNINTLNIFKAQNVYNELFYKYCLHHYGFYKASILLLKYTSNIMKLQKLIAELKSTACDHMDITQLTPVMQSLL